VNQITDINPVATRNSAIIGDFPRHQDRVSRYVETVVCLDKKKPKDYIEIGVDAEDYYKIKDSEEAR
jgi:hypothetical protein